jgi:hypothetical protein
MAEAPRSNRPTPRTPAATEAELRRRIRSELEEARNAADGQLDDTALAAVIARAISAALEWHREGPEHTRNATLSSRTWRPAGGPRGARSAGEADDRPPRRPRDYDRPPPRDFDRPSRDVDRPPRDFDRPSRDFDRPPPRDYDRPPRDVDRPPPRDYDRPPPRDYDRPRREYDRDVDQPPREYDRGGPDYDRGPRGGGRKYDRKPRNGGRPPTRGGGFKRGGFGPRRPPRPR